MATFTNQATLSYNDVVTSSNVVTGTILAVISATKSAVKNEYSAGDNLAIIISIVNSGDSPFSGLKVTEKLGEYPFGAAALVPLNYVEGSLVYYENGVLKPNPTVVSGAVLEITGINVPAHGNAMLIFEVSVNKYAPLGVNDSITNIALISGGGLGEPVEAKKILTTEDKAQLSISKSMSPLTVSENGIVTYTFIIQNNGNTQAAVGDNVIVNDTFAPVLGNLEVTLNGTPMSIVDDYSYDPITGVFATVAGKITVPPAEFKQDSTTGVWTAVPGVSTLVISGVI